jgi:uncharacterized protein (DUF3820 family)
MKCNHVNTIDSEKIFSNGTQHIERRCDDCTRFIKYVPQEVTFDKVLQMTIPVGKYSGRLLIEIFSEDYDYVIWMSENFKGPLQRGAQLLMQNQR